MLTHWILFSTSSGAGDDYPELASVPRKAPRCPPMSLGPILSGAENDDDDDELQFDEGPLPSEADIALTEMLAPEKR